MVDSEQDGQGDKHDEGTCPICGQEYVHKAKMDRGADDFDLRADYVHCVSKDPSIMPDPKTYVFVHEREERVVSHVKKATSKSEAPGIVQRLTGGLDD